MTRVGRDIDRAAVYAAELAAFDGTDLEADMGYAAVARVTEAVLATSWWPVRSARVQPARSDAASSSTRCAAADGDVGDVRIRFARGQCTVATAAHELAHVLAGPAHGHDPQFRAAYLDVISVITNLTSATRRHNVHVDQLRRAFAAVGLPIAERTWPPPPPELAGAIAL